MTDSSRRPNGDELHEAAGAGQPFLTQRSPLLRLRIVGVPERSDRATLYPADAADIDRMETWLTLDASVVRDLSACR